jgi:hypothetical protein
MARRNFVRVLGFFLFPLLVFLLDIVLNFVFDLGKTFPSQDIPLHFLGGFSIAYSFVLLLNFFKEEKLLALNAKSIFILVIVSLVCLAAVLWEFYEFLMFLIFELNMQPSVNDIVGDLFFGFLGGLAGSLVFRKV